MNKITITVFFSFLYAIFCFSQQKFVAYQLPDSIPDRYIIDKDSLKEVMSSRVPEKYRTSIYADAIDEYTGMQAEMVSEFLTSGNIYLDWDEVETYVNEIVKQTLPSDLIEKHHFRAYVTRDASLNAFVMNDGAIFVNIGLLAKVKNEAALAFVIGHEVSHHLNHDVIDRFVKENENRDKYESDRNLISAIVGSVVAQNRTNSYSRDQESDADQLGLKLIKESQYDVSEGVEIMALFSQLEEKYELRRGGFFNGFLVGSTHPEPESRYKSLKRKIKTQKEHSSFLVDEERFYKIHQIATYESLESLLRVHQMYECFEMAFPLWLDHQDNDIYRYYLMESLRRMFYTNPYQSSQSLFMNEYRGRYRQKRKETDAEYQQRIAAQLKNVVGKALSFEKERVESIELPLWKNDTTGLITYNHLFNLVAKTDELGDYPECYLSKGLKKYVEGGEYKELFQTYLQFEAAKNKQVAQALLDTNQLTSSSHDLLMLTKYQDPEETDTLYKVYQVNIDSVLSQHYPSLLYKSIDDDEIFSFGQSIGLSELTGFMNSIGKNGSGSFNAWIYNPQYLEVYTDLGINKLHFLQVQVVEKEAELIHQIVVKTIDLKSPKNQSTWVSKRKETTDYHAIESMLKEALEVNTRYFK